MSPGGHVQVSGEVCCKERGDEVELVSKIHELAGGHGRYGYRRVIVLLKWEGWNSEGEGRNCLFVGGAKNGDTPLL